MPDGTAMPPDDGTAVPPDEGTAVPPDEGTTSISVNAFSLQGEFHRSWQKICHEALTRKIYDLKAGVGDIDKKKLGEHYKRIKKTETLLAFGYAIRQEQREDTPLLQAHVVNVLSNPETIEDFADMDENIAEVAKEISKYNSKESLRVDIGRRYVSLDYFGLVKRDQITATCVQISVSEFGREADRNLGSAIDVFLTQNGVSQ